MVDLLSNADSAFKTNIQDTTVFKSPSESVQNEIFQAMCDVCREHILSEIEESAYLALMLDDVTDVSNGPQIAVVLRYELHGKIFERFWGFAHPKSQDSSGLCQCVLEQIAPILQKCPEKLICQTHDGHMRGVSEKLCSAIKMPTLFIPTRIGLIKY